MTNETYTRWAVYIGGKPAAINAPPIDSEQTARAYAQDISKTTGALVSVLGSTTPAADRTFVGKVLADFRDGEEVPVPEDA